MLKRNLWAQAAAVSMAGLMAGAAHAQETQPPGPSPPPQINAATVNPDGSITLAIPEFPASQGVLNRARPEYDELGLRLGDFWLDPSISVGGVYNSNVLNTESNPQSDAALEITPVLRLVSDFPRHALQILLSGHSIFYDRLSSQNTTDFTASIDGRLDMLRSTNLVLNAAYQILHEALGSPDIAADAAKPTAYRLATGQATFNQTFNRLALSTGATIQDYDYSATSLAPPATPSTLDNHDRDRIEIGAFGQAGYEFSPGYSVYLRGSYNDRDYSQPVDNSGFRRNSQGYEADAGVRFEVTRLIVGQVYGGYLQQFYSDPAFRTFSGAGFGAQIEWYPTELTTVRFNVRRSIDETTLANASSYTDSHFGIGVDHELLRNLILSADAMYDDDVYNGVTQRDKYWSFSFGAMYLVNRNFQINAGYVYSRRASNLTGLGFIDHAFRLSLVAKL